MSSEYVRAASFFSNEKKQKMKSISETVEAYVLRSGANLKDCVKYEIVQSLLQREEQAFIRIGNGNFSAGDYRYLMEALCPVLEALSKFLEDFNKSDATEVVKQDALMLSGKNNPAVETNVSLVETNVLEIDGPELVEID